MNPVARVFWITLGCNLAVAIGKMLLGISTGMLAILADGLHSLLDSSGNVVGLVALRYAAQPPDDEHPYGHARFETLGALLLGLFLVVAAWEIFKSALERLIQPAAHELTIDSLNLVVLLATLLVNVAVSRYQLYQAQRLQSVLLRADAQHTQSDVWVTSAVLVSMLCVHMTGWAWLDTVTALVVVGLILRAAWQIARQTVAVLVDTAPYAPETLKALLPPLAHDAHVLRVRSRGTPKTALIDVDLALCPRTTIDEANTLAQHIRDHLNSQLEGVQEIEVHFAPRS